MVDPITIVAAVAAVISAFNDGWGLFRKWRRNKTDKNKAPIQDEFDRALIDSPDDVQKQFDTLSKLAGPEFVRGDSKFRETVHTIEMY
jgi:hypothetical protein